MALTHTFLSERHPAKGAQAVSTQESPKDVAEGVPSNLCALLHMDFPVGFSAACLADLCALCTHICMAAAHEGPC